MNRRDTLKALGATAVGAAFFLESCKSPAEADIVKKENIADAVGREVWEVERLEKLMAQPDFFDAHEMATITVLADIIIPADDVSGSASDAGVPEFIGFIVKDMPSHQLPLRGGIKWLDRECLYRFEKAFIDCSEAQQLEIVKEIAYPELARPEMKQGVAFFDRMRFLTASGFYTTKMGIDDIGYVGNKPNTWPGVPQDVLAQYGLEDDVI